MAHASCFHINPFTSQVIQVKYAVHGDDLPTIEISKSDGSGDQVTQVSIGIVAWGAGYWFDNSQISDV